MGIVDYNSYAQMQEQRQNVDYKVGFFKIKDFETKVVKLPYTSVEELQMLVGAHQVKTASGSWKLVDCIRQGDDKRTCPLCNSGEKLQSKLLLKMVEFPVDRNGVVQGPGKAVCWAAPKTLGEKLKGLVKIYKDKTPEIVFIISRGKGANGFTEYNIEPDTDNIFKSEALVADFSNFADFEFDGTVYHTKTYEEMEYFVMNGEFPAVEKATVPQPTMPQAPQFTQPVQPAQVNTYAQPQTYQGYTPQPQQTPYQPYNNVAPAQNAPATNAQFNTGKRYY